jgi:hypothetical protein
VIAPAVLAGRARYERVMDGWVDNTSEEAFTHTVQLADPERSLELEVEALPSPSYAIRAARCRVVAGEVAPAVAEGIASLAGAAMVGGLTRRAAEAAGGGPGAALAVDALIEVARLARQVARLPRARAERATAGAWECWQLDTTGWVDLPDSCFTYSAEGRARFATRTVVSPMQPDLYSPRPGQRRVFERRKVARLERDGERLHLFHSMHDNVHGFELRYTLDVATGRILAADSLTPRLPYAGICSEPQGKIAALVGETADAGLRKRIQGHLGGVTGCAQLHDLTSDLLKLLA